MIRPLINNKKSYRADDKNGKYNGNKFQFWWVKPNKKELLTAIKIICLFIFIIIFSKLYLFKFKHINNELSVPSKGEYTDKRYPISIENNLMNNNQEDYPIQDDEPGMPDMKKAASIKLDPDQEEELEAHNNDLLEESIKDVLDASSGKKKVKINSFSMPIKELGGLLFSDAAEYMSSPNITIPDTFVNKNYRGYWYLQKMHDDYFTKHMHKLHIPHLDQPISRKQFHDIFRLTSTPVVMKFEHLRHLGVTTKGWELSELRAKFPYEPDPNRKQPQYKVNAGLKSDEQLDLGPALYELEKDSKLKRGSKGSVSTRNFPRNLMIKPHYLSLLDAVAPPFLPKQRFQVPTLWMGTTTADTRLHSDCCDNFVSMIAGTKRWFIAPPSEARLLKPLCTGKHQSLCWANALKYPTRDASHNTREKEIKSKLQYYVLDLKPGEMLYLPAGWWHQIENLTPNVMFNQWTRGCSNSGLALNTDPFRKDRPDFHFCPKVFKQTSDWLTMGDASN